MSGDHIDYRVPFKQRSQDDVGDPLKFQQLLDQEKVPVPAFLRPTTADLDDADLPVTRYTSYDFHRLEAARLWPKAWQFACREEQLLNPGDHIVYDIVDASIIVMRGADGALRGFHNSCLHRGRALRNTSGNTRELRCPFHGFTWDLQGAFKSMPCAWDFKHLDRQNLKLPQVRVETWGGFVFVNFDEQAPALIDHLGVLPDHFRDYLMDRSCTLLHVQKRISCNWKVGQEAFFESMHVRHTHPEIMSFIADVDSQYDVLDEHITRMITPSTVPSPNVEGVSEAQILHDSLAASGRMSTDKADEHVLPEGGRAREYIGELNRAAFSAAAGADLSQATHAELQDAILYSVFPNLQIWAGYFANIVYRFIPDGDDPNACLFDVRLLGRHPEGSARPPAPPMHRLGDDEPFANAPELGALAKVFDQDMRNLPYMMKGLRASKKGTISLAHYQESRIRAHHQTLDRYLGLDRSPEEIDMTRKNLQWLLKARPANEASNEHFEIRETELPTPAEGQVLVRNIYLLVPASMRIWMNEQPSYFPAQPLGEVMMGITLGQVEISKHPAFRQGQYVNGMGGWQHYSVSPGEMLQVVTPHPEIPLAAYRSVLDVQGITAHYGVTEICKAQSGQTMVVTAAAGSVGSLAAQIGKKLGLRVIGIAGGADKCRWLVDELKLDGAIDYKSEDIRKRLASLAPAGVNCLFENVGPPIMDAVLDHLALKARVALCGLVSTYNTGPEAGSKHLFQLIKQRATMEGFLVLDALPHAARIIADLEGWIVEGSLKYEMEILDGLERTTEAMSRLFHGKNRGVQLIRIAPETL